MPENAQNFERKTQSKTSCDYRGAISKVKIARLDDAFPEFF